MVREERRASSRKDLRFETWLVLLEVLLFHVTVVDVSLPSVAARMARALAFSTEVYILPKNP
jgi:hypothetical protein